MPDKPDLNAKHYCKACANQVWIYLYPRPEHNWFLVKQGTVEGFKAGGPMEADILKAELQWWMDHYGIVPHMIVMQGNPTAEELKYIGVLGAR